MLRPILDVAEDLGLTAPDLTLYGDHKAKVGLHVLAGERSEGRLILVSAITPTPAGEGKTTTTIGLAQAMRRMGHRAVAALREPSMGPCFGVKGGGTGGGRSCIEPSVDINLHFNGDFHAVTSAHNLLAAAIDNHLHQGNALQIDPRRVLWPRVLDVNDRSLRNVMVGLGGVSGGMPRQGTFDITAASEVMAILCLSEDPDDLRRRLDRILVAFTPQRKPIYAHQLGVTGALMALLRDAMRPNLVQTTEGTPVLVHGGPFANIAHGCSSVIATRLALKLGDWAITEAGFGFDLGAEKFFDIKCRQADLDTAAVVLVATVRALKYHGGVDLDALHTPDAAAVERGLANLDKHIESVRTFKERVVVAINRFDTDHADEIEVIRRHCADLSVPVAVTDHFARGGDGAYELARTVVAIAETASEPFEPLYSLRDPVPDKIRKIAAAMYGASGVAITQSARRDLASIKRLGLTELPICMAKTQSSLSDNPRLRGRPRDFQMRVRRVIPNVGAGFLVVLTGDMMRMPGLPREPQALHVDLVNDEIVGIR